MFVHSLSGAGVVMIFEGMLHQNLPDSGTCVAIVLEEHYSRTYLTLELVFSLFWGEC